MTEVRVLHVINLGTTCGGAERLAAALAAVQRAQGHQVRVLSSDRDGDGVRFSDVTWPQRTGGPWWRRLAGLIRNPAASAALVAEIRQWRPDVVHLHTVGLLSPSALRALAGVPTVHTLHGPELFLRRTARYCMPASYQRPGFPARLTWRGRLWLLLTAVLLGPLWRRALRVVDLRIAPSRYIAALAGGTTVIVPNGLTTAPQIPAPAGPAAAPIGATASPPASRRPAPTGPAQDAPTGSTRDALTGSTRDALTGSTRDALTGSTRDALTGSTRDARTGSTRDALTGSTRDARTGSTRDARTGSTRDAPTGSTRDAPTSSTPDARTGSARDALTGSVRDARTGSAQGAPTSTAPGPRSEPGVCVVFAGRLVPSKGPQVLIEAVPRLLEIVPGARVTVCGDGPLLPLLRRRIEELGIGHAVELTGWLDPAQVAARIAAADVVVVPSVWPEGFGLTCLEALAAGRAVVASDVGALGELITPGRTGLLVPPGDPDALAGAAGLLLGNAPLRERLGGAGQARSRDFDMDTHHAAVLTAYTAAMTHPRGTARLRRAAQPAEAGPPREPARHRIAARLREDSLLRNSAMLLAATVALAGGGFVFWQVVARLFAPAAVGEASALISVSTLLANVALLGMNNSLIRYLDRWPDPARTVNTGVLLVAAAATVGATGFVLAAPLLLPGVAAHLTPARSAAFVALTVAAALGMLYDNVFVALRRSGHILSRNVLVVALRLVLPGLLAGLGAFGVFGAYWLAFAVALVPNLVVLGRTFRLHAPGSIARLRDMWRYSIGTHLSSIILMLPTLLMPALVTARAGPEAAARFYIAALVASVLLFVPQAVGRGLFAEAQADGGRAGGHLPRVLRLTAMTQLPLLVLLIVAGWPLLRVFGAVYADAYPLLVLLAIANALNSVGYVGSTLLLVSGRIRLLCLLSGAAYGIAVVGGWLVAPLGLLWIGGALLAGEIVLAIGYAWVISTAIRAGRKEIAPEAGREGIASGDGREQIASGDGREQGASGAGRERIASGDGRP
ncbi:glycosyltransferase involved in cell wall biosynthesis/O-antigen/teichoic acid export membrane protein [Catenuloplanes nepalensis]|uniref:Glycosyltransferase involved in cell wall biosynthesis/O-antigen/teichoic acid export membrane protein n=1 Tax=Catenuloplanes nepalensis TaxID=587533 RepID=A0ABT9MRM1_9ACTN|nr:glycosyltransferase [Catenuloplanes nepalensis]MDP9794080.1 glycosyltransferase involved in cell wall biosynthesis/O-antigen/teichoic acid export membrane protein [Catenuloplanes nepalensis]